MIETSLKNTGEWIYYQWYNPKQNKSQQNNVHGWPSTQPNRITHNLATAPSCSQPSDSVVCCLGCVQFVQTAMLVGPTSVLSSRRWANVSTTYIAVWLVKLWRGLPIRMTHTTEPAHHWAAGLCAAGWCAARLCAIRLGCAEGHPRCWDMMCAYGVG